MVQDLVRALLGGALIGVSVSLMLLLNGRVTGISGIVNGVLRPDEGDASWRWSFIIGLLIGGTTLQFFYPAAFEVKLETQTWLVVIAGLLVGFGTILGSGCTSGHGVCGISRLSPRSLIATVAFICAGILAVALLRQFGQTL